MYASMYGNTETVEVLLQHGAGLDLPNVSNQVEHNDVPAAYIHT